MPMTKKKVYRYTLLLAALCMGAYACITALWELGNTALYVHRAVVLPGVVTDVRQRPFSDMAEAWQHGNLTFSEATAYQPFVSFTLPAGIAINKAMPNLDSEDYTLHQNVEVITHPHDPNQAHLYKAKFLCGWSLIKLIGGILLLLPVFYRWKKRHKPQSSGKKTATQASKAPKNTPRRSQGEEDFRLESPEPGPAKKRRTRKQNPAGGENPSPKRKKSSSSTGTTRRRQTSARQH